MKKLAFSIALLLLVLTGSVFAQKEKLIGTWELVQAPAQNGEKNCYTVLRNFDKNGNYIQIASTPNGAIIQTKAIYKEFLHGKLTEYISLSSDSSHVGKTFSLDYRFLEEGGHQFLILEKGTKVNSGYVTVEWREGWRKVEEYKQ
jgi:hypothetical protein